MAPLMAISAPTPITTVTDLNGCISSVGITVTPTSAGSISEKISCCPGSTAQPFIPGLSGRPVCRPAAAACRSIASHTATLSAWTAADTDTTFLDQKAIFGTTAWWKVWGRRNIVESANAAFHGEYVDIGRNYTRFLKTAKIKMFLAHTIAGYNRRTIKQWLRLREPGDTQAPAKARRKTRKNRRRRYEDLPSAKTDTNTDP